jgi:uncharacterized membrane protein YkvA (DUF1232 family)
MLPCALSEASSKGEGEMPIDPKRALVPYLAPAGDKRERQERKVREEFWGKLKRYGRQVPFAEEAVAAFYCATDSKTPASARALLFAALAYFIAPIDIVPDLLVLVGFGDDLAVLMSVFAILKTNITEEHRAKARDALKDDEPKFGDKDGPVVDG